MRLTNFRKYWNLIWISSNCTEVIRTDLLLWQFDCRWTNGGRNSEFDAETCKLVSWVEALVESISVEVLSCIMIVWNVCTDSEAHSRTIQTLLIVGDPRFSHFPVQGSAIDSFLPVKSTHYQNYLYFPLTQHQFLFGFQFLWWELQCSAILNSSYLNSRTESNNN